MIRPRVIEFRGKRRFECPLCAYDASVETDTLSHIAATHKGVPDIVLPEEEPLSVVPIALSTGLSYPKISCIMATKDRRAFVQKSIEYFENQTWPNKELLVIDDGQDGVCDLVNGSRAEVQYIRTGPSTIGAKRNLGCRKASGEFFAVWDDDEWQSPNRLALQYYELLAHPDKQLCGIYRPIFGVLQTKKMYLWNGRRPSKAWCSGSTIMFKRALFNKVQYPSKSVGEDTQFITDVPQEWIHQMEFSGFNVSFVHGANTVSKNVSTGVYVELDQPFPV